jgi:hypothetical protein
MEAEQVKASRRFRVVLVTSYNESMGACKGICNPVASYRCTIAMRSVALTKCTEVPHGVRLGIYLLK